MHTIIDDLNWRYATKKFDSTKKVSENDLSIIKEALRLTASSYGLQPLKYLIVESPELRAKLVPAAYGQAQVADASHLLILCSYQQVEDSDVDAYINNVSTTRNLPEEAVAPFGNMIKGSIKNLSAADVQNWTAKQAYIALGQLLQTCATLRIDATPMEGFDPKQFSEVLGLSEQNLIPTVVCPIGYRHEEDAAQHYTKVRKSHEDIFEVK